MNLKQLKKLLLLFTLLIFSFSFISCRKPIDAKEETVVATIVDTKHENEDDYFYIIPCGKTVIPINDTEPEHNYVEVEYNNLKKKFDNKDYYDLYKDHKYEQVECTLRTTYYDNSTTKIEITSINKLKGDD